MSKFSKYGSTNNQLARPTYKFPANNPEKKVPNSIKEQFFLILKSGKIDKIRNFVNETGLKYNMIDTDKGNDKGKTAFHVVLELDNNTADNNQKLEILKFLDEMGAPMDLPDGNYVWPIHLAAKLQSKKIIDFLISKNVDVTRKDSSNNTALHTAIMGKHITCPKKIKIKSIVPDRSIDKMSLNKSLEELDEKIVNLIANQPVVTNNLIHMINTIRKLPEMYQNDEIADRIQNNILKIVTQSGLDKNYLASSDVNTQVVKIQQLIEENTNIVNDDILKGLLSPIDLAPNNGGWGPTINGQILEINKITKETTKEMKDRIYAEAKKLQEKITDPSSNQTDRIFRTVIPPYMNQITTKIVGDPRRRTDQDITRNRINNFLDTLMLNTANRHTLTSASLVTLSKMLPLQAVSHYRNNYVNYLSNKIISRTLLMNNNQFDSILRKPYDNTPWTPNKNVPEYLFAKSILKMITDPTLDGNTNSIDDRNITDVLFDSVMLEYQGVQDPIINRRCMYNELILLFASRDDPLLGIKDSPFKITMSSPDIKAHNEFQSQLGTTTIVDLLKMPLYRDLQPEYNKMRPAFKKSTFTWFKVLNDYILFKNITPTNWFDDLFTSVNYSHRNNPTPAAQDYKSLPRTPLDRINNATGTRIRAANQNSTVVYNAATDRDILSYSFNDLFRIMYCIQRFLLTGNFSVMEYPTIYDRPINEMENYIDTDIGNLNSLLNPVPIRNSDPEFILLYKILVRRLKSVLETNLRNCLNPIIEFAKNDPNNGMNIWIEIFQEYIKPASDLHLFYLTFPNYPETSFFTETQADLVDPDINTLRTDPNHQFTSRHPIMQAYNAMHQRLLEIDPSYFNNINIRFNAIVPDINTFNTADISRDILRFTKKRMISLRRRIYDYNVSSPSMKLIEEFNMRTNDRPVEFDNLFLSPIYNRLIVRATYRDQSELLLKKFNDHDIHGLYLINDIYELYFVRVLQQLFNMQNLVRVMRDIISDIMQFINVNGTYYVAQIFLPAYIKQFISVIECLITLKELKTQFDIRSGQLNTIDLRVNNILESMDLYLGDIRNIGIAFQRWITPALTELYTNIIPLSEYHNEIVR